MENIIQGTRKIIDLTTSYIQHTQIKAFCFSRLMRIEAI